MRSSCARFQFSMESSWACSSAKWQFLCVFVPRVLFWSDICHVLAGTNRITFLYLWGADNESTKKAAMRKAYELYFGCKVGDQYKFWASKICCCSCARTLTGWLKGTHTWMPFDVPMVWRHFRSHLADCCCSITNVAGFSVQSKHKIEYPNIPSALRPVPHDGSVPMLEPPEEYTLDSEPDSEMAWPVTETSTREDQDFSACSSTDPHFITQAELNALSSGLGAPKNQGSATWIKASAVEPSRKGCESVIL